MGYMLPIMPIPYDTPPEPIELKNESKKVRDKHPDIDSDFLHVWFKQQLPKHLWNYWKDELKRNGFTWQSFLKAVSFHKREIIAWLRDEIDWEQFIESLRNTLVNHKDWFIK